MASGLNLFWATSSAGSGCYSYTRDNNEDQQNERAKQLRPEPEVRLHDNNATWTEPNIDCQLMNCKYHRIFFDGCQQFYDQEIGYSNVQPGVEISSGSIPLSRSKASIVIIKRMSGSDYSAMLEVAKAEARKGLAEGGIPIGAAVFDESGKLVGAGHNRRVQIAIRQCMRRPMLSAAPGDSAATANSLWPPLWHLLVLQRAGTAIRIRHGRRG